MAKKRALTLKGATLVAGMLLGTLLGADASRGLETSSHTPDLRGLVGPYRFKDYCSPNETELWTVEGEGTVRHYTTYATPRRFSLESAGSFRGGFYGVYFNKEGAGWVVGDSGVIFHSPDRGATWVEQSVGGEDTLNAVTCADNSNCWAVGERGLFLRTIDGGKVWMRRSLAPESVDLNAVEFINKKTGWIAGDDNLVLRTKDGGLTWESYKVPLRCDRDRTECGVPLFSIRFVSGRVGWVASYDQIARTTDGGQTWKTINFEDDDSVVTFVGLISTDGKKVWAVNAGEHNYLSEDAGRTWRTWTPELQFAGQEQAKH